MSTGDLCFLVGLDARPFDRDLDLDASILELQGESFEVIGILCADDVVLVSFKIIDFLFKMVALCST